MITIKWSPNNIIREGDEMWVITVDKQRASLDMRPGQCLSGVAPKYGEGERGGERGVLGVEGHQIT